MITEDMVVAARDGAFGRSVDVHVTEKRAPTDESVRLLREMEQAARNRVVESVNVGDTTCDCVLHQEKDILSDSTRWCAIISINGKKLTIAHAHGRLATREQVLHGLRDAIARQIANCILSDALSKMERIL